MLMDQRVISTSAVRCVGNTLLLQGRVYSPPYRITAIGNLQGMRTALDNSAAVQIYREFVNVFQLGYDVKDLGPTDLPGVHRQPRPALRQAAPCPVPQRVRAARRQPFTSPSTPWPPWRATRPALPDPADGVRPWPGPPAPTRPVVTLDDPHPRRGQLRQLRLDRSRATSPSWAPSATSCATTRWAREDAAGYDGVLLSPGPGTPAEAGSALTWCAGARARRSRCSASASATRRWVRCSAAPSPHAPDYARQDEPRPPRRRGVLEGLPSPFTATRYHSLAVLADTVPAVLDVTGTTESGVVMALQHRELPLFGCSSTPSPCSPRAATGCSRTGSPSAETRRRSTGRPGSRRSSAAEQFRQSGQAGSGSADADGGGDWRRPSRSGSVTASARVGLASVSLTVLPTSTLPAPGSCSARCPAALQPARDVRVVALQVPLRSASQRRLTSLFFSVGKIHVPRGDVELDRRSPCRPWSRRPGRS